MLMESRVFLDSFTLAWEQRKFDEVFDCTIPNNTLSRAELNYESGSVRNIHYGDILIKYGSVVDVQNDEIPFATGKSSDDFKGALLQDGDIIIADTAEDETTGKACEIGNSQGLDVVSGLHTMVCRPRDKMALGYLGYYLNSDAYHHQLLPLMQGIKVLSLSRTNVQKTMVCYPKSNAEQQLIADCFRNLDKLITLHQCKESAFSEWKDSGFLQKHKTTWEQRKAKELCSISTGKSNTQDRIEDGKYPFYVRSPIVERSNRYLFDEEAVLTVGDGVGTGKVFHYVNGKYDLHQRVYRMFGFSEEISAKYFYYYFSNHFYDRVMAMTAKTSVDSVRYEMIADMEISLPNKQEQICISMLFEQLDNLITLHQRKPFCINRRQKWKQTTKMQNYSANIMQNGFQYIRKGR